LLTLGDVNATIDGNGLLRDSVLAQF
jgi:hypothetical protein